IQNNHFGRSARGPPRFNGSGRPISDLEEAHQTAGLAAAGQRLAFAAQCGEVTPRTGTVFKDTCLTDPQVHDAAFIHQIVLDGLDEAVVYQSAGAPELAGGRLDVIHQFRPGLGTSYYLYGRWFKMCRSTCQAENQCLPLLLMSETDQFRESLPR